MIPKSRENLLIYNIFSHFRNRSIISQLQANHRPIIGQSWANYRPIIVQLQPNFSPIIAQLQPNYSPIIAQFFAVVGGIASVPCNSNPDKQEYITRYCKMGSPVRTKWSSPDFSQCTNKFSAQLRSSLNWNISVSFCRQGDYLDLISLKNYCLNNCFIIILNYFQSVKEGAKAMHNICKGVRLLPSDIVQVGKSLLAFNKDNLDGDMDTVCLPFDFTLILLIIYTTQLLF